MHDFTHSNAHTPTDNETTPPPKKPDMPKTHFFKEVLQFSLIALLVVVPIRYFIAQPFIVSGASMDPTFQGGEYLIVDQLSRYFETPRRGDVVIFKYPKDPSKFFIKRIIGLPGETVALRGTTVTITPAAAPDTGVFGTPEPFTLDEPYVDASHTKQDFLTVALETDEYFVLGDNRSSSSDSRVWGALPEDLIVGRAFVRLLPVSRVQYLPGFFEQSVK